MNRGILWVVVLLVLINLVKAQGVSPKPFITNETYKTWDKLGDYAISADGKFVWYNYGSYYGGNTLVLASIDGTYRQEYKRARDAVFSQDGNYFLFKLPGDSLGMVHLKKAATSYLNKVNSFTVIRSGKDQLLAIKSGQTFTVKNLNKSTVQRFDSVKTFLFNPQGTALVVQTISGLTWIEIPSWKKKKISCFAGILNLSFDSSGSQLVFNAKVGKQNVIALYRRGLDSAWMHVGGVTPGISQDMVIDRTAPIFTVNGNYIFFKLQKIIQSQNKDKNIIAENVNVWSYKDKFIQSEQQSMGDNAADRPFYAVIATANNCPVVQLEDGYNKAMISHRIVSGNAMIRNREYVLTKSISNEKEAYWNESEIPFYRLISLKTGEQTTFIPEDILRNVMSVSVSNDERFVTWMDTSTCNIYTYEMATGITRGITVEIQEPADMFSDHGASPARFSPLMYWLKDDKYVLVSARYDIWQVDPLGIKPPINITGAKGRKHTIAFSLEGVERDWSSIENGEKAVLTAFDEKTKNNGLWTVRFGSSKRCEKAIMEPFLLYSNIGGNELRKASNVSKYLATIQTSTESPNLYVSTDLKVFKKISDIHPEKNYNWLTSELITYPAKNGGTGTGILYKPENFNPLKRYPIIFHYYQVRTNGLHQFPFPKLSTDFITISWYVSNGYLIFVPDILNYERGRIAESVVNSVVSAAEYLSSKYSWVDHSRMGLQGHSFGGYETNILITKTNLFAAANTAAGLVDVVSVNGSLGFGAESLGSAVEKGQFNFGVSLWERQEVYLRNSPIFELDKVQTPLMIMHNKDDMASPFTQAIELYLSLRRLKKPVWLLQYDGEHHALINEAAGLDFTIRQEQFFNHYLRGQPAPLWMTRGIHAGDKGIKSGLVLDLEERCSAACSVCDSLVEKNANR